MTVDTLLASDDPGVVWLLDVSFDDFATVSYRWATASGPFSGYDYDGRIASLTPITRSLGRDHLPAASTFQLVIENTDFAADWMADRSTVATQLLKARFKLTAVMYQSRSYTAADALTSASQLIGYFSCLDQPEMTDSSVSISLADDSLGRLAEPLTTPSVRDWKDAPLGALQPASDNPYNNNDPDPGMDWDVPLPLVFGLGEYNVNVPCYLGVKAYAKQPRIIPSWGDAHHPENILSEFGGTAVVPVKFPIVVCACAVPDFGLGASAAQASYSGDKEITRLWGTYKNDVEDRTEMRGITVEIPRKYRGAGNVNGTIGANTEIEIWRPRRTQFITKNGRRWQVIWIEFNVDLYVPWFQDVFPDLRLDPRGAGDPVASNHLPVPSGATESARFSGGNAQTSRGSLLGAFASFQCNGSPLSVISTVPHPEDSSVRLPSQRLVDHIFDLIAYYSRAAQPGLTGVSVDIDSTAFARAAAARRTVLGMGIVQPSRPRPLSSVPRVGWVSPNPREGVVGILRTALGEMCASCDADLFMTKDGKYALTTNVFDYTAVTASRVDIDESRIKRPSVRTPSAGERWAPYNRIFISGPGGASFGPFDNQTAIDAWGVVLPLTIEGRWNQRLWGEGAAAGVSTVWEYRTLESKVRPVIRFLADRAYLGLDLGDYFTFTWTRGGHSAVFSGTIFRVEGIRIDPTTLAVQIDAVWTDDLATDLPFLLDDEDFLLRWSGSGGGALNVTDGSDTVTDGGVGGFTSIGGVQDNDILVLKDTTQAANVFTRYRKIRIDHVDDDFTLILAAGEDLDFDAPVGASVAAGQWYIERGKRTYPTSATDPVNYPAGGTMYGKACTAGFVYSDASAANKLLDG
jgi:hypothetical protein